MAFWDVDTRGRFPPQKAPMEGAMLRKNLNEVNDSESTHSTTNQATEMVYACPDCGWLTLRSRSVKAHWTQSHADYQDEFSGVETISIGDTQ